MSWIISGYFIFENFYLDAKAKSERDIEKNELSLDEKLQADIEAGRLVYDELFDPNEVVRQQRIGQTEIFINMCDSATCKVVSGLEPTLDLCNGELSTSRKFYKYRVYSCRLEVSVANDQPMECDPVTWNELKGFCDKLNNT